MWLVVAPVLGLVLRGVVGLRPRVEPRERQKRELYSFMIESGRQEVTFKRLVFKFHL